MLNLTRRLNESIYIYDDENKMIKVKVTGIRGTQVRLGIEAPKNVQVHREEIYKRIKKEENKGNK